MHQDSSLSFQHIVRIVFFCCLGLMPVGYGLLVLFRRRATTQQRAVTPVAAIQVAPMARVVDVDNASAMEGALDEKPVLPGGNIAVATAFPIGVERIGYAQS